MFAIFLIIKIYVVPPYVIYSYLEYNLKIVLFVRMYVIKVKLHLNKATAKYKTFN